jgi:two-component system sensor histidine kinase RpfC
MRSTDARRSYAGSVAFRLWREVTGCDAAHIAARRASGPHPAALASAHDADHDHAARDTPRPTRRPRRDAIAGARSWRCLARQRAAGGRGVTHGTDPHGDPHEGGSALRQALRHPARWWARFRLRPDSEHEQALIRLAIAPLMTAYLYAVWGAGLIDERALDGVLLAIVVEMVVTAALLFAIVRNPGISHPRRVIGMLADFGTSALAMHLTGEAGTPFAALFIWIAIGNGHRFGRNYLRLSMLMSGSSFLTVMAITPFWHEHLLLGTTFLIAMQVIPAYQSVLLTALIAAKEESMRANQAKTWFLASTSHELRTPLTGVIGMIDALEATPLREDQANYVRVARASARSLLTLVHDVLDISAIESGILTVSAVDFSLRELMHDIELMLASSARSKGLRFELNIAEQLPDALHGDSDHLRQILVNLIANAIKFTPSGFVRVDVERGSDADDELLFAVTDSGVGIEREAQAKIFEAFSQAHTGRGRRYGGTGLGTTIARELATLLGGRIGFESEAGRGSRFWVRLPLPPARAPDALLAGRQGVPEAMAAHRAALAGRQMLVVDDQPTNRLVIREVLLKAGHSVHEAAGGEEALERLSTRDFDLVICDFHMPGLTGLDVLRELRMMESPGQRTPFILLTADLTRVARDDADAAGVTAFLPKPLDTVRLLQTIEAAVFGRPQAAGEPADERSTADDVTIDPSILRELADAASDRQFLPRFLRSSFEDAHTALDRLQDAGRSGDWNAYRDQAHALRGIAANMGVVRVAAMAAGAMRRDALSLPAAWSSECAGIGAALDHAEQQMPTVLATIAAG